MPAYNVEAYLPVAVNSIISQTFQDWELIIVDDCSTDSTFEIANEYAEVDRRIRVLRTDVGSGGPFVPRKMAIENATADLIAPIDADDMIKPDYLESLLKVMCESGVEAVYPVLYKWDGKERAERLSLPDNVIGLRMDGKESVKNTLNGWKIHCGGGVIRKNNYHKAYSEFEGINVIPFLDEVLTRVLLYWSNAVCMAEVPYFYRENYSSITHSTTIKALGFSVNPLIISIIRKYYGKSSEEYILAQRQNFYGIFDAMRHLNNNKYAEKDYEEGRKIIKKCIDAVDRSIIRKNVSWKFYLLSLMPFNIGKNILKYYDKLTSSF